MAMRAVPLLFATWRDLWVSDGAVSPLLAEADAALRRRSTGNQRNPKWPPSDENGTFPAAIGAMQVWAGGEPPKDAAARPGIVRRIHSIVQPVLVATAWPRWLLLERAFLDGSASGDLLSAALILRTMCEEVLRLRAFDVPAERLAFLARSDSFSDQARLNLYFSIAWTSLGELPQDMLMEGKSWPNLKLMKKELPRLEKARRALNGYVHPNY